MMFDVFDEVSKVPGSTKAKVKLAETAQKYLDSLSADDTAEAGVRLDAGLGYFRLANAVGSTRGGTLGQVATGQELYAKSRKTLEKLYREHPDRQDVQAALGRVLATIAGETLYADQKLELAHEEAEKARKLLSSLDNWDEDTAGALGVAYRFEGESLGWAGDAKKAGQVLAKGIKAMNKLPEDLKEKPVVQRSLANLINHSAIAYSFQEQPEKAIETFQSAIRLRREIAAKTNNAPTDVRNLIIGLWDMGQIELKIGRLRDADRTGTEALSLVRQALKDSPDDYGPRELFSSTSLFMAQVLSAQKRYPKAIQLASEGVAEDRKLVALSGSRGKMSLAVRLHEASKVYRQAGQKQKQCAAVREAVNIYRDYEKTNEIPEVNREQDLKPMQAILKTC